MLGWSVPGVAAALALALSACESGPVGTRPAPLPSAAVASPKPAAPKPPPAAKAPPAEPPRLRLRPPSKDENPSLLSDAVAPAWKRPSVPAPAHGDGCSNKLVVDAQGRANDEPVLARLEIQRQNLTLSTVALAGGKRTQYKGTFDATFCDHADPGDLLGLTGALVSTTKPPLKLSVNLARNDYFSDDRGRLHLEASASGADELELALFQTPPERLPLREAYQKALKAPDDVEAVLETSNGKLLVGALELGSRRVVVSELSTKPLALLRRAESLACEGHECHLELSAAEVRADLTVMVLVTAGQSCGAKCSESAEGRIWTLGPSGFESGAVLPGTSSMPGGLSYGGSSSHTSLCFTDADGKPPLELLVRHGDTEKEEAAFSVVAFDPDTHTYSRVEELPGMVADADRRYCGSSLAAF